MSEGRDPGPGLGTRLAAALARAPRRAVVVAVALLMAGIVGLPRLRLDNSLPAMFRRGDPALVTYQDFREDFGEDDFLVVLLRDPAGVFTAGCQASLFDLHRLLAAHPEVTRVRSFAGLQLALDPRAAPATDPEELADLELAFGRSPLFEGDLISRDGRAAALYALVRPGPPPARADLIRALEGAGRSLGPGRSVAVAGPVAVEYALDQGGQRDGRVFLPLSLAAAVLSLLLWHGLPGCVPALAALLAALGYLGFLGWWGVRLNMVTVALPPLLVILDLAAGIHLFQACGPRGEIDRALDEVGEPVLLATATTCGGFLALATSEVGPVRQMGLLGAGGLAFGLPFVGVLVLGSVALLGRGPRARAGRRVGDAFAALAAAARRRRGVVAVLALALLGAGVRGALALRTDFSAFTFLDPAGPLRRAFDQGEAEFAGFSPGEVVLRGRPGAARDPRLLQALVTLQRELAADAPGGRAVGLVDVLSHMRMMERALEEPDPREYRPPASADEVARFLAEVPAPLRPELAQVVSADGSATRVQVRMKTGDSGFAARVLETWGPRVERFGAAHGLEAEVTGLVPMLVRMQVYLLEGFRWSLLVSALVVLVPLGFVLRDPARALLAGAPNLWPVALVLGAMPLLGMALDAGTVMVASIALGIAVDDTLHLLHGLVRRRRPVDEVMRTVGPALAWTTAAGILGFGVLAFSNFVPLARFGLLVAMTLGLALLADVVLLPLLLAEDEQWEIGNPGEHPPAGGA